MSQKKMIRNVKLCILTEYLASLLFWDKSFFSDCSFWHEFAKYKLKC